METHYGSRAEAFKACDLNGNGELSFNELKKGLKHIGVDARDASGCKDLQALFKMMDMGKGALNYHDMFETTQKQRREKDRNLASRGEARPSELKKGAKQKQSQPQEIAEYSTD